MSLSYVEGEHAASLISMPLWLVLLLLLSKGLVFFSADFFAPAVALRRPGVHRITYRSERKFDLPCKVETVEETHCLGCFIQSKNRTSRPT